MLKHVSIKRMHASLSETKQFLCLLSVEDSLSQPAVKAINIQSLPGLQPVAVVERQEKSPEREIEPYIEYTQIEQWNNGVAFWSSFGRKRWYVMVCPYTVSQDFIFSILFIFTDQFMNQFRLTRYHPRRLSQYTFIDLLQIPGKRKKQFSIFKHGDLLIGNSQNITFNKSNNNHWQFSTILIQFIPTAPGTQMTQGLLVLNQNI